MLNNVKLVTTKEFENNPCDFFANINDEYFITREQIGTALGYTNPVNAIKNIHMKHKERLDKFSTWLTLGYVEGDRYVERERILYNRKGVMEICRWSRQPIADKFMDWCWDVIENLINEKNNKQPLANLEPHLAILLNENKYIKNKLNRLETMVSTLLPPTKHSQWKSDISKKIKEIASALGIADTEIKSIYGNIYNKMRNDYGMDINNYIADYLLTHKDITNPPAIDIVDTYSELKDLFEMIVNNYITLESETDVIV